MNKLLKAQYGVDAVPETAENVALDWTIKRKAQDRMALARLKGVVKPKGDAMAWGHTLGASAARLATTAAKPLHRIRGRYALCTLCFGVGQGIALVLERV